MTHMPFLQSDGFCGPASLKIVLSHYGIEKSEKELAKMCGATRALGCEAKDIIRAVKKFGLKAKVKDLSTLKNISQALKEKKAIIVEWFSETDGHFSVV